MGREVKGVPYTQDEVDIASAHEKAVMDAVIIQHLEQRTIFQQAEIKRMERELAEWRSGTRKAPAKKAPAKKAAAAKKPSGK